MEEPRKQEGVIELYLLAYECFLKQSSVIRKLLLSLGKINESRNLRCLA